MTVLEAINSSLTSDAVFADRLSIGRVKLERLLSNMDFDPVTNCWIWKKAKNKDYGVVKIRSLSSSILQVHRVCYELANGPVSKSLHIHHQVEEPIRCSGPSCANPEHTRPVTPADHVVNLTPGTASNIAAHRDCCAQGHPYTPENTRIVGKGNGIRQCLECDKNRHQAKRDTDRVRPKYAKDPAKFKTHCKRGHPLSGDNVQWVSSPTGPQRKCIACIAVRNEQYQERYDLAAAGLLEPLPPGPNLKDVCKNGHAMSGDNVYLRPDGTGRQCLACKLQGVKKYQAAHREQYLARRAELRRDKR